MVILPKISIKDVFYLSNLRIKHIIEVELTWKEQNIHTYATEEETMSKYSTTRIPPKQLQLIQYIPPKI